MQIVTATEIKNQLGDLFDAVEKDEGASVLIERNRRPAAMLLNAQVAEKHSGLADARKLAGL